MMKFEKLKKQVLTIIEKILELLNDFHLYQTKGEGFLKALAISFSWLGGVMMENASSGEWDKTVAQTLYLFSIALLMEALGPLFTAQKFIGRIVPGLVAIPSVIVLLVSFCVVFDKGSTGSVSQALIYNLTIFAQAIIWLDVVTQVFISTPRQEVVSTATSLNNN